MGVMIKHYEKLKFMKRGGNGSYGYSSKLALSCFASLLWNEDKALAAR